MAIDPKEHTRAELAKMAEDAQEAAKKATECMNELQSRIGGLESQARTLKAKNAALTESISQMNGEAVNKANEIARLKADADALRVQLKNANDTTEAVSKELQRVNSENDALRNKLMDAEEALGRANTAMASVQSSLSCLYNEKIKWMNECANARDQIGWARSHPWRNLWEQIKSRGC